ncbi:unnamed protein product [Urochloa decumbens]|uniref:Uncharacterized protein n=1 Tax=Urochloa decumbens TaxID=240449 RepID=A0ABC9F1Z6_9POAL
MAGSSKGRSEGKLPQSDSSASVKSEAAALAPEETPGEKKKKKTVRMSQEQIDSYLAFKKTAPLLPMEVPRSRFIDALSQEMLDRLSKDVLDRLAAVDLHRINQTFAEVNKAEEDLAMEAEDVRRQYEEKGYVEYEVTDDEKEGVNNPPAAQVPVYPAPGRRRHRPGRI